MESSVTVKGLSSYCEDQNRKAIGSGERDGCCVSNTSVSLAAGSCCDGHGNSHHADELANYRWADHSYDPDITRPRH
jgi:hypothetical protein